MALRRLGVCLVLFLPAAFVVASDAPSRSLKGITSIDVVVDAAGFEGKGLTAIQIREDTTLKLRKAGIGVVRTLEADELYTTFLSVVVFATCRRLPSMAPDLEYCGYVCKAEFHQPARLVRDPNVQNGMHTWWSNVRVGTVGLPGGQLRSEDIRALRDSVADVVDEFVSAHLEANPPRR